MLTFASTIPNREVFLWLMRNRSSVVSSYSFSICGLKLTKLSDRWIQQRCQQPHGLPSVWRFLYDQDWAPRLDGWVYPRSSHSSGMYLNWNETAGVIISTAQNPTSFDNFTVNGEQQFVKGFAKQDDAGVFCIPLNISAANITGVKDGSNVTIQVCHDSRSYFLQFTVF